MTVRILGEHLLGDLLFPSGPASAMLGQGVSQWRGTVDRLARVTACAVTIVWVSGDFGLNADLEQSGAAPRAAHSLSSAAADDIVTTRHPTEWAFGGYGGMAYTQPSTVRIRNGERSNVTISDFDWIGMPFKAPIYYGLRVQRWGAGRTGAMVDFIHAKAIAKRDDVATFQGQHNGEALPEKAPVGDVMSKLEFSHGHNILTLNGLVRLAPSWARLRPYVGFGGGVTLPHTEIGFRTDNVRTYEYQYAGLVGQALAGIEIQLGRASIFAEYKFTYAPYDIPLTHRSPGWLLVTDVWQQILDWWYGREPAGGRLSVQLTTHHAVGGVLVKSTNPLALRP